MPLPRGLVDGFFPASYGRYELIRGKQEEKDRSSTFPVVLTVRFLVPKVEDARSRVERSSDAVADKVAHDAQSIRIGMVVDGITNLVVRHTRL